MVDFKLPQPVNHIETSVLRNVHQITIIGANGSGKSRFMEQLMEDCGNRTFVLNALSALYGDASQSTLPGSIDTLYREAVKQQPYLRIDAVSQLDKIFYMLFADELATLMKIKENNPKLAKGFPKSRLDKVADVWEHLFPGNRILRKEGRLLFTTGAGKDIISFSQLSQGEKTALYFIGAATFAQHNAVIFIDYPTLFIHPSIRSSLWDTIEEMRPDCTFVYNSVDVDFATSRSQNTFIWVKSYNSEHHAWDYSIMKGLLLSDEMMVELSGSRKPVLFIEGDDRHSIDMKLYSLVFNDRVVKPLGSCNKVIESVRTFNDLNSMHQIQSIGIVDRDRRTDSEVEYLRGKQILVPDVAEVENIFLLPEVVKIMAKRRGKEPQVILARVQKFIVRNFRGHVDEQALQHTRHVIKRTVEYRIDAKFTCITAMETHIRQLITKLQPRKHFNKIRQSFLNMINDNDYTSILRVFNYKPMLAECGIHNLLGYKSAADYINGVLNEMKSPGIDADRMRTAVANILHAPKPS